MNLLTPNAAQFASHIERAKFLMVYRLTILLITTFFSLSILFYNNETHSFISYLTALVICTISLIYLIVSKKFNHLFLFYAIVGSFITQTSCFISTETTHYDDFLWMLVCSLMAFIGTGKLWGLVLLALNSIGIAIFIYVKHNENIERLIPLTNATATGAFIEIMIAVFIFGYLMFNFITVQNFAETKLIRANIDLANQNSIILSKNNENITLIKEIHHRVKNNLQIIISLLRLQQSEIKNNETKEQFTEAINRVMVMASIHQRLYKEKEVARIDLQSYISDLADDLKKIFQNDKTIHVNIESNYKEIDLKTVVPLGLLLNELMSNSYKYAFNSMQAGEIRILISEKNAQFHLTYSDNGKWIEKQDENSGFGLDLISILTEQLNGSFEFETGESGTKYQFLFSKLQ